MGERLFLGLLTPSELLAVLTAVLVGVTAFYAWQTRQTVAELRRARSASILPRLALDIWVVGGGVGFVRLSNVGSGPALDVTATFTYEPDGFRYRWNAHIVGVGDSHRFLGDPPGQPGAGIGGELSALTGRFEHVSLHATYTDALGDRHETTDRIEVREWWRSVNESQEIGGEDHLRDAALELQKIRKELEAIARVAKRLDIS